MSKNSDNTNNHQQISLNLKSAIKQIELPLQY